MRLEPGTRLGSYEVTRILGVGGMGEVYCARDPRLARDVAIKILSPSLAQDPDALARFEREAKTASALNHPHIVHIYEIGEASTAGGAVHYIAMEFVEGQTLRARLNAGARAAQLLETLAQAADALSRAHGAGIVHRDLKPENLMITTDGYPKILDFGLAKLHEPVAASESPTPLQAGHTRAGTILGTPGYMSPEQVQGRPADHRSDVFSFGCILYEATSGRQPFRADSAVATLHAIAYDEPPSLESSHPDAAPALRQLIRRCLEKKPELRPQTMKSVAESLRAIARGPSAVDAELAPTTALTGAPLGGAPRRPRMWLTLAGIALVAGPALLLLQGRPASRGEPAKAGGGTLHVEKLTSRGDLATLDVSPDGRYLAYTVRAAPSVIWLRDLVDKTESKLLSLAEAQRVQNLFFARDGGAVFYTSLDPSVTTERVLYRVPLIGGEPRRVSGAHVALAPDERSVAFTRRKADQWSVVVRELEGEAEKVLAESDGGMIAWAPDSATLLFSRGGGRSVWLVAAATGAERKITELPDEASVARWKPDGTAVVLVTRAAPLRLRLVAVDARTGVAKSLGTQSWSDQGIRDIHWLPDGSGLVFLAKETEQRAIWHVSHPEGRAVRIPAGTADYTRLGMTADGRLVAQQDSQRSDLLVSSSPEKGDFKKVVSGTDVDYDLCWTADGQIVYTSNDAGSYDLYASDPDGSRRKKLTFDAKANERAPVATPDGRYIVFVSDRSGRLSIERINRDGTGLKHLTSPAEGRGDHTPTVAPDSRWVFYRGWDNGPTLWKLPIDGGTPTLVIGARTEKGEEKAFGASLSPDGASVASFYFTLDRPRLQFSPTQLAISTLEGRIVKKFPYASALTAVGDHQRVQWSRDGATLYYHQVGQPSNLWKRPIAGGTPVQVTRFEDQLVDFEWSMDGRTLACSRRADVSDAVLITNFR
jgi:Tol biopolymer transport system component